MIKESIYDKFVCLAGNCSMTCCRGWAIKVEQDRIDSWKASEDTRYIAEHVVERIQEEGEDQCYNMETGQDDACIFLEQGGLCQLVKCHGAKVLSKTCQEFPRKHNRITVEDDSQEELCIMDEYSMSGACPAVLELLKEELKKQEHKPVVDIPAMCSDNHDFPVEYQIRNMVIALLNKDNMALTDKIMLCFPSCMSVWNVNGKMSFMTAWRYIRRRKTLQR